MIRNTKFWRSPEARKLFEKFMRDVEKLQAEQEQTGGQRGSCRRVTSSRLRARRARPVSMTHTAAGADRPARSHLQATFSEHVQGRMQRAKAGPGLLVQEAVSTSFDLDIVTLPPGHVTEASFSPELQARSHFLSSSQDS